MAQKQKSHRGARKRFKLTATGKVVRQNSMKRHILTKKTTSRKRRLRKETVQEGAQARTIRKLIA